MYAQDDVGSPLVKISAIGHNDTTRNVKPMINAFSCINYSVPSTKPATASARVHIEHNTCCVK